MAITGLSRDKKPAGAGFLFYVVPGPRVELGTPASSKGKLDYITSLVSAHADSRESGASPKSFLIGYSFKG